MEPLTDSWGREIRSLRVSVTDKCNFRCKYCMPAEGLEWLPRDEILSFEEIQRLVAVLASMGVDEIRLTGGEPLVRRELPVLVQLLAATDGVRDLSLTTNGVMLDRFAGPLVDAHRGEHGDEALDLLEAEDLLARQPLQPFRGHAVATPEVALVGDRHAQAADLAAPGIGERFHGFQVTQVSTAPKTRY